MVSPNGESGSTFPVQERANSLPAVGRCVIVHHQELCGIRFPGWMAKSQMAGWVNQLLAPHGTASCEPRFDLQTNEYRARMSVR